MKAQVIDQFGDPSVFQLRDIPRTQPGSGEVLVEIASTSVNPIDTKIRQNGGPFAPEFPAVLGCDFAGRVIEPGVGVKDFQVGDRVYGCAGGVKGVSGGAYAECIAANARLLAPAPEGLSLRQAAALPLVTLTAWEGLDRSGVGENTRLLVIGGTGGVGHVAVQLARARGAHVTCTASTPGKRDIAMSLGAHECIVYREEPLADGVRRLTQGRGFDVVFDATGGPEIHLAFDAARNNGQVVVIVSRYSADLSPMHAKGLSLHVVFLLLTMVHPEECAKHGETLREISALVDSGKLRPLLDPHVFSLADVPSAHQHLTSGHAVGKVMIDVAKIE